MGVAAGPVPLPVVNLAEARFECTYGRGCEGACCRDGRPPVYPDEVDILSANLGRFLPRMRPAARRVAERDGFLVPRRRRVGQPMLRVVDGWCIFFHDGCVLHRAGHEEGDTYRYKPAVCALFPIQRDPHGSWFVRQKGFKGEDWDLPCLDPAGTTVPAAGSLLDELALAKRFDEEAEIIATHDGGDPPKVV
jgi:Protein of unknown function (DUF3109)